MEKLIESIQGTLGQSLPGVFGALVILLFGWIAAVVIQAVLKKSLNLVGLNNKVNTSGGDSKLDLETGIAKGGYFVILLVALIAVFNQLGLEIAAQPIQALVSQVLEYIPKLIGGGILILVAWLCGTIVKQILTAGLQTLGLDKQVEAKSKPLSQTLGEIGYWLIFLVFLPGILSVFGIEGLLQPAQGMLDKIMNMLPNIMAASIIGFAGWLIAKILRDITSNMLAAAGIDKLGKKVGLAEQTKLSALVGTIVYIFTFIPAVIASLNALEIATIAGPATEMLAAIMAMIPNLIAATAILVITYFVARPVSRLLGNVSKSAGLDQVPQKIGIAQEATNLSAYVEKAVVFFMMLFAAVEASNQLQFAQLSEIIGFFIQFGGQVLLGAIIIATGMWIANIVTSAMNKTSPSGKTPLAAIVKVVILGLVFAMGLRAMGIADDIINMAFGLTLGSAAIAFALSFGLGGREAAGRQMEYWFEGLRNAGGKSGNKNRVSQNI